MERPPPVEKAPKKKKPKVEAKAAPAAAAPAAAAMPAVAGVSAPTSAGKIYWNPEKGWFRG